MKRISIYSALLFSIFLIHSSSYAQFDILKKVQKSTEQKVNKRVEQKAGEAVDDGLDGIEDGATKKANSNSSRNKNTTKKTNTKKSTPTTTTAKSNAGTKGTAATNAWSEYKFTPGTTILFDDLPIGEEKGEFPSRWNLIAGSAEVSQVRLDQQISFLGSPTEISPVMTDEAYLPDVFTLEFDGWFPTSVDESYWLKFKGLDPIRIKLNGAEMGNFNGVNTSVATKGSWRHVALWFNKGKLKLYVDQDRVLNIPKVGGVPTSFSITAMSAGAADGDPAILKNVRLSKDYSNIAAEYEENGKVVTHGIRFAESKAKIWPQSHGVINAIVNLLNAESTLRLSINVHAGTGTNVEFNQLISENRAKTIQKEIIARGIPAERVRAKGFGNTQPLEKGSSAEAKANNERVEFVEF